MNKALEFGIRTHFHLAIFSFVYIVGLYKRDTESIVYAAMFSFGILAIYNSHRLYKLKSRELPESVFIWVNAHKWMVLGIAITSLIVSLALYLCNFDQSYEVHFLTGICIIVSFLYVYKIGHYCLREIPFLKIFLVLGIWFFLLHTLPILLFSHPVSLGSGLILLIAILIPSDMKDIRFDPKEMYTIPQILGINRSLYLLRFLSFIGVFFLIYLDCNNLVPWLISFVYLFILTFFHRKIGNEYYFVWVDGSFLITGLGLLFT